MIDIGNQSLWIILDDRCHPDQLGFIPSFIHAEDERPVAEQLDERYAFGGWSPQSGFTADGWNLLYSGDPPLEPLAMNMHGDETVLIYPYGYVAIFQQDGSFEAARLD